MIRLFILLLAVGLAPCVYGEILYRDTPYTKFVEGGEKWLIAGDEKSHAKYVGALKEGVPHGHGTITFPDGEKYIGDWKNGKEHGQGIRTWSDGGEWAGTYWRGVRFGGDYTFGTDLFEGLFRLRVGWFDLVVSLLVLVGLIFWYMKKVVREKRSDSPYFYLAAFLCGIPFIHYAKPLFLLLGLPTWINFVALLIGCACIVVLAFVIVLFVHGLLEGVFEGEDIDEQPGTLGEVATTSGSDSTRSDSSSQPIPEKERSYYQVLQVSEEASDSVIRMAYKALVQQWHPDKNIDNRAEAEEQIRIINAAHEVLSDPARRRDYDQSLARGQGMSGQELAVHVEEVEPNKTEQADQDADEVRPKEDPEQPTREDEIVYARKYLLPLWRYVIRAIQDAAGHPLYLVLVLFLIVAVGKNMDGPSYDFLSVSLGPVKGWSYIGCIVFLPLLSGVTYALRTHTGRGGGLLLIFVGLSGIFVGQQLATILGGFFDSNYVFQYSSAHMSDCLWITASSLFVGIALGYLIHRLQYRDLYDGNWKNGQYHGEGTLRGFFTNSNCTYVGDWMDGLKHGIGIETSRDGKKRYEGEWKEGKRHGHGHSSDWHEYTGEWEDDLRCGKGKMVWGDDEYDGDWKNDFPHGRGIYYIASEGKYEGDFVEGSRHGEGTLQFVSGGYFTGEWRDDAPWHGKEFDIKDAVVSTYWMGDESYTPSLKRSITRGMSHFLGTHKRSFEKNAKPGFWKKFVPPWQRIVLLILAIVIGLVVLFG